MDVDGEKHEQVPQDGDLDAEGGVAGNVQQGGEVGREEGDDQHDIGNPEVDVVEEEVTQ